MPRWVYLLFMILVCQGWSCQDGIIETSCENGVRIDEQCYPTRCEEEECTAGSVCANEICTEITCLKMDCPDGQTCHDGVCGECTPSCQGKCGGTSDGCNGTCTGSCPTGQWCNGTACAACNLAAHCGTTCINCAGQANNKDCVEGTCGCDNAGDDCAAGATCDPGTHQCSGCAPDCTGKCGGASDGCGGTCSGNCTSGQWCNGQACAACDVAAHCGPSCANCAAQANNKDCVSGACGCDNAEDGCAAGETCNGTTNRCSGCAPDCTGMCGGASDGCSGTCSGNCPSGQWCNGQACATCDVAAHCGSGCQNCAAQASNKECIGGVCGCNGIEDCATGQVCKNNSCCTQTWTAWSACNCTQKECVSCAGTQERTDGCGGTDVQNCTLPATGCQRQNELCYGDEFCISFGTPAGYQLTFLDDFQGPNLDLGKWVEYFLPHWSDAGLINFAKARYVIEQGILKLRTLFSDSIWSVYDGQYKSGMMTGNVSGNTGTKDGLHEFGNCKQNPACVVWSGMANQAIKFNVTQYGYFEMRAKFCPVAGCDWWMVGYEDDFRKSGEIDIFEFSNDKPSGWNSKCVHFGIHPWDDPNLNSNDHFFFGDTCSDYHGFRVYGFEWLQGKVSLYIDGQLIKSYSQSPGYEMVHIISVGNGNGHSSLPPEVRNQIEIDYFRILQKRPNFIPNISATMVNGTPYPSPPHPASHAVDGNLQTYAQAVEVPADPWDLEMDLRALYTVSSLKLMVNGFNYPTNYEIQIRRTTSDGWTTIQAITGADTQVKEFTFNPPQVGRYMKINVTQQIGSYAYAIHEVEVYGSPGF